MAVSFEVATTQPVRITLTDALGRQVRVIAAENRAAGPHRVEIDTHGLAPGLYVVRLATTVGIGTRSIAVVR